ncbi:MAG: hypothetical protein LBE56_13340 [Tannerella sp.]|jgi:hypothetical protein|nr:hypothetical protein [Tannerella sp.]
MNGESLFGMTGRKAARIATLIVAAFLFSASGNASAVDTETIFMKMVDELKGMGDECRDKGLSLQADYFYAQADVAASSFRLAVNQIYIIRNEQDIERRKQEAEAARKAEEEEEDDDWMDLIVDDGGWFEAIENIEKFNEKLDTLNAQLAPLVAQMDSLEAAAADRKYNLWHYLASQSPASPFPWLFEGIVAYAKNRQTRASECFSYASINHNLARMGKTIDFDFLLSMPASDLAALYNRLTVKAATLRDLYVPRSNNYPRHFMNFDDVYLRLLAKESMDADPSGMVDVFVIFEAAVRANPFEPANFAGCTLAALGMGDVGEAAYYLNQGLLLAPEDETLNTLLDIWKEAAK